MSSFHVMSFIDDLKPDGFSDDDGDGLAVRHDAVVVLEDAAAEE